MKYVDWVERVLRATVEAFDAASNGFSTDEGAVLSELGLDGATQQEALWDAFHDLTKLGLITAEARHDIRISPEARKIRVTSLRTTWPRIHRIWLEDRQERFLVKLSEMSEQREDDSAHLVEVQGDAVLEALGETPNRGDSHGLITALEDQGLLDASRMMLGSLPVFPTYAGIARATEKVATEGQGLVDQLLDEWETTNTEFKVELHLRTKDEKAEFIRDVLALANTQVTGDRYLVTGFDNKTHAFTTTVDPKVTQDMIEDILNEYTKPPMTVRYRTFPSADGAGEIGLLEVIRDRTKVPYRVRRSLAGEKKAIEEGGVYVRHGSHVAKASGDEIADLEAESRRARGDHD